MFMDLALAQRIEQAEGAIGRTYVEARSRSTGVAAVALELDGVTALFDGVDSPFTQSFGLGVTTAPTAETLAALEAFFFGRGSDAAHEVSPFAGAEVLDLLVERGYRPIELSNVLVQPLAAPAARGSAASALMSAAPAATGLSVRPVDPEQDAAAWIDASVAGWASDPAYADLTRSIAALGLANRSVLHYFVERAGSPVATGSLALHGEVAVLIGASTIPSARGLGAQNLLLTRRLAEAAARHCTVATIITAVGSASQRNAERRGFRIAYTRSKWRLRRPSI